MQLSPHFTSGEFRRRGGKRIPSLWMRAARELCTEYLEPLRLEFGPVTVTSGFRTLGHNSDVGGAPASMHLHLPGRRAAAADVVCARGTPRQWYELLDRLGCPGLGLYDDHVHADNRAGHARW